MLIKLLDHLKRIDVLDGLHIGEVVDNSDPSKKGNIRVVIKNVIEGPKEKLPWVYPKRSFFLGGGGGTALSVPKVGSKVAVYFPSKDVYTAIYDGTLESFDPIDDDFLQNYPNRYGFKDKSGNSFVIDETDKTIELTHSSGTKIFIDEEGNIVQDSVKNYTINTQGDTFVNAQGKVAIDAQGDVTANTQGNASVTAQGDASVNAQGKASLVSSGDSEIQAGGNVRIQSGGMTHIN